MQRIDVGRKDQWLDWCEMLWFLWFLKISLLSYILMRKRQCDIINLQLGPIIFMCSLFVYEHLVCKNKTSNSFFCIGTLVSSSYISAQAHFIFHQTIIQSELCLQLSPSCQRADDMILAALMAGLCSSVPELRGWDRWKILWLQVSPGDKSNPTVGLRKSGCLPTLKTVPERPERDALARFQTRDPVFLFSRHYSRVHIWHGSDDIRRQRLLPGSKNNREQAFSVCRKTIRTDYWCYLQEQHNTKQQWRDTAAADQTSWGGNIRYVESNAISSFLVERLPHEDLRRKELWRQQHKQQLGVFVGKKADYSPQIHIRTWLGAEFSPNFVHVRDGLNIDFRIDSCSLFNAALVCFSHPSSMF